MPFNFKHTMCYLGVLLAGAAVAYGAAVDSSCDPNNSVYKEMSEAAANLCKEFISSFVICVTQYRLAGMGINIQAAPGYDAQACDRSVKLGSALQQVLPLGQSLWCHECAESAAEGDIDFVVSAGFRAG